MSRPHVRDSAAAEIRHVGLEDAFAITLDPLRDPPHARRADGARVARRDEQAGRRVAEAIAERMLGRSSTLDILNPRPASETSLVACYVTKLRPLASLPPFAAMDAVYQARSFDLTPSTVAQTV